MGSSVARRWWRWIVGLVCAALVLLLVPPIAFYAWVWWHDPREPLPPPAVGTGDMGRLSSARPLEVIAVPAGLAAAEQALGEVVRRATAEKRVIAIAGAQHSMGGQTLAPDALVLDLRAVAHVQFDEASGHVTVGAGARWRDVIQYLDRFGKSVTVMQSNSDFSVGGSLSVNCHGWQHDQQPIAGTVQSLRLLKADGQAVTCSAQENPELFKLALGGYGLFGVILEAKLETKDNPFYKDERHSVTVADYADKYDELIKRHEDIGMAYGRISVAPLTFLRDAHIYLLREQRDQSHHRNSLTYDEPAWYKRLVARGIVGSGYGKELRWFLEKRIGENANVVRSRNQVMLEPSGWYANRTPGETEILHEYFVPHLELAPFLEQMRGICERHRPDLLNITVRNVRKDETASLAYARDEVFGLVMLFHLKVSEEADAAMQAFTREMIDAALAHKGTYYLPYRLHATREQFHRAYPNAEAFIASKRRHDPQEIFQNELWRMYGAAN